MITNKDLSIIIPCKNERNNIIETLNSIYKQNSINNIDVIISDSSDDDITVSLINNKIKKYKNKLNIKIIKGGYPSEARLNGSNITTSKYILFIDADILLKNKNTIKNTFNKINNNNLDLLTISFETDKKYNYIYKIFDIIQKVGSSFNIIFAVGGFQLWNRESYLKTGGYNKDLLFAEDYFISSKVDKSKFTIYNKNKVYTSSRRFKSKGIYYMFKMLILSYINRNNIEFFKKEHNYWK